MGVLHFGPARDKVNICGLFVAFILSRAGPKCNTPFIMLY